jgi:hypothetical protein
VLLRRLPDTPSMNTRPAPDLRTLELLAAKRHYLLPYNEPGAALPRQLRPPIPAE